MVLSVCLCPKTRRGGSVWTVMVFSVEELLKLWSEFEDGEKLASIDEAGE